MVLNLPASLPGRVNTDRGSGVIEVICNEIPFLLQQEVFSR